MIITNQIGMEGLLDRKKISKELLPLFTGIVSRFEAFRLSLMNQLKAQVTVFHANPDTEPEKIAGFKDGDLAIWVDTGGTSRFRVLIN